MIATGGQPKYPPVPGAELGITSDGFFELEQLPRRVAVVGSGYIAVELAGVLRALGSEVTLCIRHDAMLRHFDSLLGEKLMARCARAASTSSRGATRRAVDAARRGDLTLEAADGRSSAGSTRCSGRSAARRTSIDVGLESAGVALDAEGFIAVDRYQNTSTPRRLRHRRRHGPGRAHAGRDRGRAAARGSRVRRHEGPAPALRRDSDRRVLASADRHRRVVGGRRRASVTRTSRSASTSPSSCSMFYALTDVKPQTAMKLVMRRRRRARRRLPRDRPRRRRDDPRLRGRRDDGRAQARLRRHDRDPSDERRRARDDALTRGAHQRTSCFKIGFVSGRTPRQMKNDSAACSISIPQPCTARPAPCLRAQTTNGVSFTL